MCPPNLLSTSLALKLFMVVDSGIGVGVFRYNVDWSVGPSKLQTHTYLDVFMPKRDSSDRYGADNPLFLDFGLIFS